MRYPHIRPDFDDSVVPSQLHAAAELYFMYQYERSKVFQVVGVLQRLFQHGRLRMNRGPGARGLYLLEKWQPLRYSPRHREAAYRRAFNYGVNPPPAGAVVNRNFHRQLVGFIVRLAQYFRDLLMGEVEPEADRESSSARSAALPRSSGWGSTCAMRSIGRPTATSIRWPRKRGTISSRFSRFSMRPTSRRPSTPTRSGTS